MLKKYWFFFAVAIVITVAFSIPEVGRIVRNYKILSVGIFISFLLTGLSLETASIFGQLKQIKVLVAAIFSSLIFFPVIAYCFARLFFPSWPDFSIGALIVGVAPVTVASGTVMTMIALGNVPLSLFINVLGNFFSILTIPIMVKLILQFSDISIQLPVSAILLGLALKVLLPTVIGQILRIWLRDIASKFKFAVSIFSQCIVLLIILNAVSSSTHRILQVGITLILVFAFMIALHVFILIINKSFAVLIRLDLPSTAAFTIHTSQKTLTVSYLVWAGYFAAEYPMALIPAIAYHLTQLIMDTFVAQWFRSKAEFVTARSKSYSQAYHPSK